MEQQIRDTSATILNFLRWKRQLCIFHAVQDLEWSEKYCNMAPHLRDTSI
jgi:hypothetical protein